MRLRATRSAAILLTFSASSALAQGPCDLLPEKGMKVETVSKPGPTAPFGPGRTCPPFWRVDGNVCRGPDVQEPKTVQTTPRDDCYRSLKLSISQLKDHNGRLLPSNVITKPGPVKLLIEGDGAANAATVEVEGGIVASVGDAARRLGATIQGTCLPPNCQVVSLDNLANVAAGRHKLTLYTPHKYRSASVDLTVDVATPMAVSGDAQCLDPAQATHLRITLASSNVGPMQSVSGSVVVTGPLPTPPPGQQMKLNLHGSLVGVSQSSFVLPSSLNSSGQVTFGFSVSNPNQPVKPLPPNFRGGIFVGSVAQGRRCVWASLEGAGLPETVATIVTFTP